MRLMVGITQLLPEWEIVIQQIGVPFEIITPNEPISTNQFSVVIVSKKVERNEKDNLLQYLISGGSILAEADVSEWLFNINTLITFVNTIEPTEDPIFSGVLPGFIQEKLFLPQNGSVLESASGKKLVQIHTAGKGTAIILPGGFSKLILNTKVKRRNFSTRTVHLPSERVAYISKHTIREIIHRSLEYLHFIRHLPFVSLSPFPEEKQSIFNFRVDTDFASKKEIDSLYQLCLDHDTPATWFVETKSARNRIRQFARMRNQEIGLHCYRHKVSRYYSFNKFNLNEGCQILNKANIPFCGFAAPYGEWNIPLAKTIEEAGFIYSSEFTLDYDNLPFYPYLSNRFSSVLQIPIHPISIGRLRNARYGENDIKKYFKDVVSERIEHNLPLFFYDHPSSTNLNVLNWLLQYINKKNIPTISLKDYANWWKKRMEIKWAPELDEGRIVTKWQHSNSSMYVLIKNSLQESVLTKMENVVNLHKLKWQKKKSPSKLISSMALRIQLNRKMIINDFFHFYGRFKQ